MSRAADSSAERTGAAWASDSPLTVTRSTATSERLAQPQPARERERGRDRGDHAAAAAPAPGRGSATRAVRRVAAECEDINLPLRRARREFLRAGHGAASGGHEPLAERADVAGAEHQQHVVRAQARAEHRARRRRTPAATAPRARARRRRRASATSQPADAREVLGALARRVDVEHAGQVGGASARPNAPARCCGARVEVRLEGGDHAPRAERPRGGDRRRDLGRVVGVVVDDAARRPRCARGVSKRRPAPLKLAIAATAACGSAPASRAASSAATALRALCSPGTASATSQPAPGQARRRRPASCGAGRLVGDQRAARRAAPAAPGRSQITACAGRSRNSRKTSRTSCSEP